MQYRTVEGLVQISFFVHESDKDLAVQKLEKIGVPESAVGFKTFPPSPYIREQWIVNINQTKSEFCVNCNHVNTSHQENEESDKCYGLDKAGNICNCIKFIPIEK